MDRPLVHVSLFIQIPTKNSRDKIHITEIALLVFQSIDMQLNEITWGLVAERPKLEAYWEGSPREMIAHSVRSRGVLGTAGN